MLAVPHHIKYPISPISSEQKESWRCAVFCWTVGPCKWTTCFMPKVSTCFHVTSTPFFMLAVPYQHASNPLLGADQGGIEWGGEGGGARELDCTGLWGKPRKPRKRRTPRKPHKRRKPRKPRKRRKPRKPRKRRKPRRKHVLMPSIIAALITQARKHIPQLPATHGPQRSKPRGGPPP